MNKNRINLYIGIFKSSWTLLWANFRILVPILIPILIGVIAPEILMKVAEKLGYNVDPYSENYSPIVFVIIAFAILVNGIITMGFSRCATLLITNHKPAPSVFYNINDCVFEGLKAIILTTAVIAVASLFLIIPGIYFALQYHFVLYFIALKGLKMPQAIQASSKIVQGKKLELLAFLIVCTAIIVIGHILIFIVLPFILIANTWLFHQYCKETDLSKLGIKN